MLGKTVLPQREIGCTVREHCLPAILFPFTLFVSCKGYVGECAWRAEFAKNTISQDCVIFFCADVTEASGTPSFLRTFHLHAPPHTQIPHTAITLCYPYHSATTISRNEHRIHDV